jgi:hypothetical protein
MDVRKEKRVGMGLGPILAPHPEMIAPDQAFPARPNIRVPVIVSQLHDLIRPTITVA